MTYVLTFDGELRLTWISIAHARYHGKTLTTGVQVDCHLRCWSLPLQYYIHFANISIHCSLAIPDLFWVEHFKVPSYTWLIVNLDLPYIYSTEGKVKEPNLAAEAGQGLLSAVSSYARGDMVSLDLLIDIACRADLLNLLERSVFFGNWST